MNNNLKREFSVMITLAMRSSTVPSALAENNDAETVTEPVIETGVETAEPTSNSKESAEPVEKTVEAESKDDIQDDTVTITANMSSTDEEKLEFAYKQHISNLQD